MADQGRKELADKVRSAKLVDATKTQVGEVPQDPLEVAEAVLSGDIEPDDVPEHIMRWVNSVVDIPFVPEKMERELFDAIVDLAVEMVASLVERY